MRMVLEWETPAYGDVRYFLVVARGILNGFTPYSDLFESKPPGIFLILAASLHFTQSLALARVAQILVLFGLLTASLLPILTLKKWSSIAVTILFGLFITTYTAVEAGLLYPESFGACFIAFYALILFLGKNKWTKIHSLSAAVCLFLGIGMKEPFLFSACAVALILCEKPQQLLSRFIIPLCVAAVAGLVCMAALGFLKSYLTFYLPFMLSGYSSPPTGTMWLQGLRWNTLARQLMDYAPTLGLLVLELVLMSFFMLIRPWKRQKVFFACILAIFLLAGTWAMSFLHPKTWPLLAAGGLLVVCALLWGMSRNEPTRAQKWHILYRMVCILTAGYLLILIPGLKGEFLLHHCVFSVPIFLALFFECIRYADQKRLTKFESGLAAIFVCTLTLTILWHRGGPADTLLQELRIEEESNIKKAALIDAVLTQCGWDRYLILGGAVGAYDAYTMHSPYGPGFIHEKMNILVPAFRKKHVQNIRDAKFMVMNPPIMLPDEAEIYMKDISRTPPPCAKDIQPPPGVEFWFK